MGKGFVIFLTPWPAFRAHMGATAFELFPCAAVLHDRGGGLSLLHSDVRSGAVSSGRCILRSGPRILVLLRAFPGRRIPFSVLPAPVFRLARSRFPSCPLPGFVLPAPGFRPAFPGPCLPARVSAPRRVAGRAPR